MKFWYFTDISWFPKILSLKLFVKSGGNSYIQVYYWESGFVTLVVKGKFAQPSTTSFQNFINMVVFKILFAFLTALLVKYGFILAGIYFIFMKKSWKTFNIKFGPQWKDRESSFEVKHILRPFCKLVALILGYNCTKELRITKISKKINLKRSGA